MIKIFAAFVWICGFASRLKQRRRRVFFFKYHLAHLVSRTIFDVQKLLAAVGVEDMIMVETKKAVLIVPKSKAQSVKHIVEWLKEKGMTEYL